MSTAPSGWQTPKTHWLTSDPIFDVDLTRIERNINAIETGNRTVDPLNADSMGNTGNLGQMLSWITRRLHGISGELNWFDWNPASLRACARISPIAPGDRWMIPGLVGSDPLATGAPSANILRAMPLVLTGAYSVNELALRVTTGIAASSAWLGIYSDVGIYPASLLASVNVSTVSTGMIAGLVSGLLESGLYWLAVVTSHAPTIRTIALSSCWPILGITGDVVTPGVGWSVAHTFGVLPATFPAGAAPIVAVPVPAIHVRRMGG